MELHIFLDHQGSLSPPGSIKNNETKIVSNNQACLKMHVLKEQETNEAKSLRPTAYYIQVSPFPSYLKMLTTITDKSSDKLHM